MNDREMLLEIFAEQVIQWAQDSLKKEDSNIEFAKIILDFSKSLGLPL